MEEQAQAVLDTDTELSDVEQDETVATIATPGETPPVFTSLPTPRTVSDAALVANTVCEGAQPAYESQPQALDPTITVEGVAWMASVWRSGRARPEWD